MLKYLTLVSAIIFISCISDREDEGRQRARALFEDSRDTIMNFRDSVSYAADSVRLHILSEEFSDAITKVNYKYAPDTDLLLTEEENDSLIKLMSALTSEIAGRKAYFVNLPDSLSHESQF